MKILFDTSAIVAACVNSHPKHLPSLSWLNKVHLGEVEGILSAHSLLETYKVLTSTPFQPKISPQVALRLISQNVLPYFSIGSFEVKDYVSIVERLSKFNISGGIVYDALIATCAEKASAQKIITANPSDFLRLAQVFQLEIEVVGI